jgi:hypothetical protein
MTENQSDKEGFASRWSRRKQQVRREPAADMEADSIGAGEDSLQGADESGAEVNDGHVDAERQRAEQLTQLNALTDADMPDITVLNDESDFSQFMSTGVSDALRNKALQKLFHGAAYNIRDGLDEYDGDYTHFEKLDPATITSDMRHRMEMEAEKLKEQLEAEAQAVIEDKQEAEAIDESQEVPEEDLEVLEDGNEPAQELEVNDETNIASIEDDAELQKPDDASTVTQP